MHFHIITLFPESFSSYIGESIVARAIREKKVSVKFYNPRDFVPVGDISPSQKKNAKPYLRIDDKPYGGGPGMVMQALPVVKAIEKAVGKKKSKAKIIFLSPSGEQFSNTAAAVLAKKYTDIVIVCGRYEGIDARVKKIFPMTDISVGPFVLTGGELPALIILDAVSRQIEGVLGNFDSLEDGREASAEVYTRPEVLVYKKKKYRVPKVLLSGDHKKIQKWREERSKGRS